MKKSTSGKKKSPPAIIETSKGIAVQSKGGRPSKYTPELVEEIAERLSKGEPLAQICRDEGMPHAETVRNWQKAIPEVFLVVARAREDGFDAIAIDCLNIADDNGKDTRVLEDGREVTDNDVVQRARLRIETRLKLLACWDPKRYGAKIDHTSGGEKIPVPIVTFQSQPPAE